MAWFFTLLTSTIGLGLAAVAATGVGIAVLWAYLGLYLGQVYSRSQLKSK